MGHITAMRPRDWFSVGLRLFGVWVIYDGFTYGISYVSARLAVLSRSEVAQEVDPIRFAPPYYLAVAIGTIAFGIAIIWGAERFTRWAFNEPTPLDDPGTDAV